LEGSQSGTDEEERESEKSAFHEMRTGRKGPVRKVMILVGGFEAIFSTGYAYFKRSACFVF